MTKNRRVIALAIGILAVLGHVSVSAQTVPTRSFNFAQSLTYLSWKFTGDSTSQTVSQLFVPVYVKARLADDWGVALYSSASRSSSNSATSPAISGLNDSKVQLTHSLAEDRILLSAGASFPTGKTKLSATERELIPWLTADFFNFPVKIPGEGLELFGEVGVAVPASMWVLGMAGAVHYYGKYTPYDDERDYQPGMRVIGTAGLSRDWSRRGHIGLDVVVIYSTNDKVLGSPVFGDGLQLDFRLVGSREFAKGGYEAAARFIQRGKNKILSASGLDLVNEQSKTNGNDFRFHCSAHHSMIGRLQGWGSFDTKILMANGYPADNPLYTKGARIFGFGGGLDLPLGTAATIGVGARIWTGSSGGTQSHEALDLSGYEINERLSFAL
jgi:hypothetical protein